MKYYIISGEASGDLHGSNLIYALKSKDEQAQIRAWGGDRMQAAGATLAKHYKDLAFMGLIEVLKNLKTILKNFSFCHSDIRAFEPDALILIDYSGFNLRIAKWAKRRGYRIFYYIAPQVWATRRKRVFQIKKYIDRMFVTLPFEKDFYASYDYSVDFVGHPLLDVIAKTPTDPNFRCRNKLSEKPIIALLPGSRRQEINATLEVMLSVRDAFPSYQFVIGAAPSIPLSFYEPFLNRHRGVHLITRQTYALLQHSTAALVTAGTATLETALFQVPQVVCYRANRLFYWLVRRMIKVKYISLVNLVLNKEVVEELIQKDLHARNLSAALTKILDSQNRQVIIAAYQTLKERLGHEGAASNVAQKIQVYSKAPR